MNTAPSAVMSPGPFDRPRRGERPDSAGAGEGGREWDVAEPGYHGHTDPEPAGHGDGSDTAGESEGGSGGEGGGGGGDGGA